MSELSEAINEMRNMRESYDQIAGSAEAYNTGKVQLAENITAKGVQASATETLPELAEKVAAITQETYEINGGEMYAKQLFGSLTPPKYWNLYEVLTQLLSDGRLVNYGGILLAEYYRGYDSFALAGAGSGGAYVVSDKDEQGNFKMYTEDTTHTWAKEFDGYGDRWVAYCFADEYHDFQITDTNTSPRSIFIGRKVGNISLLANSRISQIVGRISSYVPNNFSSLWQQRIVLDVETPTNLMFSNVPNYTEIIYLHTSSGGGGAVTRIGNGLSVNCVIIQCDSDCSLQFNGGAISNMIIQAKSFNYPGLFGWLFSNGGSVDYLTLVDIEEWQGGLNEKGLVCKKMTLLYYNNDKSKSINMSNPLRNNIATDVELKDGWCKPLNIVAFPNLTKANVQANIFDRLGVNDLSTGAVTITLATAVLNLFTQEEIDAVVARTNITVVGA